MNLWIGINWVKKNYGNQAERSCQRSGSRPSTFLLWKDYNFRLQMIFAYLENIYCSCDAVPVTARGPSYRCLKKVAVNFILSNCSLPSFFSFCGAEDWTHQDLVKAGYVLYHWTILSSSSQLLLYFLSLGYLETLLYMIFNSVYSSQIPNTNSNLYTMNLDTYHQPQLSQRCHTVQQKLRGSRSCFLTITLPLLK